MPVRPWFVVGIAALLPVVGPISIARAAWTTDGSAVCVAPCDEDPTSVVSDSHGGMYLAWNDNRLCASQRVYLQHLTGQGTVAPGWPALGLAVCTFASTQSLPKLAADAQGGVIVSWSDLRRGYYTLFAQRYAADGAALWDPAGVAVCEAPAVQLTGNLRSDGAGGVYIAWRDRRKNLDMGPPHFIKLYNAYAQHLDAGGARAWGALGAALCDPIVEGAPLVLGSGGAGTLIAWGDGGGNVTVQRLDDNGAPLMGADGVTVPGFQYDQIAPDGAGGLIGTYQHAVPGGIDLYAQRVDGTGAPLWGAEGRLVAAAPYDQRPNDIVSDGAGGAYVTWHDLRNGTDWDVYVQRVTASGDAAVAAGWTPGGTALCQGAGDQSSPIMTTDGGNGALLSWHDGRSDADVYSQRIGGGGIVGDTQSTAGVGPAAAVGFALGAVFPNPAPLGELSVSLSLPSDAPARVSLIDAQGRVVARRDVRVTGGGRTVVRLDATPRLAPGVYLVRLEQSGRSASRPVSIVW